MSQPGEKIGYLTPLNFTAAAAKSLLVEKATQTAFKAKSGLWMTSDSVKTGLVARASKVVNGFQSAGERMAAGIGPQLSYAGATDGARVNLNFIQETQKTEKVTTSVGQETEKTVKSAISDEKAATKEVSASKENPQIHQGQQDKHIVGTSNYNQQVANGKHPSILTENPQKLLDEFSGKGDFVTASKERVDFGRPIGKYYDINTGKYMDTNRGIIHYSNHGDAHIVPSNPNIQN